MIGQIVFSNSLGESRPFILFWTDGQIKMEKNKRGGLMEERFTNHLPHLSICPETVNAPLSIEYRKIIGPPSKTHSSVPEAPAHRPRRSACKPEAPIEFRRLKRHSAITQDVVSAFESGEYSDWPSALAALVFALAAEVDRLQRLSNQALDS
ncbi:hypothetical protein [Lacipirellula sp.]|uniref:hypothetical protein n=1 Tax=Lacipirellula sp. TaxID=2691419 RepID=UPI003D0E7F3C